MAKNLEKYDKLVIVVIIIISLVLGVGYWFAQQKSEPVYLSKIDRLMFDKNNKSPAYVLTLPDKLEFSQNSEESTDDLFEKNPEPTRTEENLELSFSLEDLINKVPNVGKLPNKSYHIEMKNQDILPNLTEILPNNMILPKKGNDGRRPWIEYGYTVNTLPNFKKIAIIICNLGFDPMPINKISSAFPPELSVSFHPYLTNAQNHLTTARSKGHETYMDAPLASHDFTKEDTGPLALNFNEEYDENLSRLHKIIAQPGAIGGIIIRDGAVSPQDEPVLKMLLEDIRNRGLLMIDATLSNVINDIKIDNLARRKADILITKDMSSDEIDEQIKKAENMAFDKGQVLIITDDKPLTIIKLYDWIQSFSPQLSYEESKAVDITKPFALVPASNLVVE